MDKFAAATGRQYQLYQYVGAPDAERVVVLMGSAGGGAHETGGHLVAGGAQGGAGSFTKLTLPASGPG